MSYKKYIESERRTKISSKKIGHAIFPDGDESDCSSSTTYYDIRRQSSSSTSYSERSSSESLGAKGFKFEDEDDGVFIRLNSLSTDDSECKITTKRMTTTISSIDINIYSPDQPESGVRPSTKFGGTTSDDVSNESSMRSASFQRYYHNKSPFSNVNPTLVPCIDVISPSPTLSVFSERLVIQQQKTGLLARPSVILSPISSRTMTPRSSFSSNSTISDNIHEVYSLEKSYVDIRDQLLQRRNVLPPIVRAPEDQNTDSKKKRKTRTKKTKIKVFEECSTRSSSATRIKLPRSGRKTKKVDKNTDHQNDTIFSHNSLSHISMHFNSTSSLDQADRKSPFKNELSKQNHQIVKKRKRNRRPRKEDAKTECNSIQTSGRSSQHSLSVVTTSGSQDHSAIKKGTAKAGTKKNIAGIQKYEKKGGNSPNLENSSERNVGDDRKYQLRKSEEITETQSEISNFSVTKKCLSPRTRHTNGYHGGSK